MRIKHLMLRGIFLVVLIVQCAQEVLPHANYGALYGELQSLVFAYTTRGTTEKINDRLRVIRNEFISGGDPSADFLILQLVELNREETRFLGGRQDHSAGLEYMMHQLEEGKSPGVKNEICWMLADMFPKLSNDRQSKVLTAIVASFTPSTYGPGEMSPLFFSLLRIGPRSVTSLLALAKKHPFEAVRCESAETLNDVGREWKKDPATVELGGPPEINCKLPESERLRQIENWNKFWELRGNSLPFQKVPSFFDLPTTKPR